MFYLFVFIVVLSGTFYQLAKRYEVLQEQIQRYFVEKSIFVAVFGML